jgi:hypothetical protein
MEQQMSKSENDTQTPSQVDEAAELAEQLYKKMYPDAEEEKEVPAETHSEDEPEDTSDEDEPDEDEEEEPEVDPKELKKWRDRYLTLKGKYDAEVPRLASQVKDLMEKATSGTPKEKVEPDAKNEIDEFEEVYGTDFVNKIRKVIDQEVQTRIHPVTEKVDSIATMQDEAASESFKSYLDDNAVGWRDLWDGKDKGFIKFLGQKDPMGLNTYGEYLTRFNNDWDAEGMTKIFNIYKENKPTKKSNDLSKEQEAMIAPSRTKSTNTPTAGEKTIWTEETMKQFESDDRNGKYSDEESQAKWADLLAAASEGRIRR